MDIYRSEEVEGGADGLDQNEDEDGQARSRPPSIDQREKTGVDP